MHISYQFHLPSWWSRNLYTITRCQDVDVIFLGHLSRSLYTLWLSFSYWLKKTWTDSTKISSSLCKKVKKFLYVSLVQSKTAYCSEIWRPYLIKDIIFFEKILRQEASFILKDYLFYYWRSRLISLHLLPLMYLDEHLDIFLWGVWNSQTQVCPLENLSPSPKHLLNLLQMLNCLLSPVQHSFTSCLLLQVGSNLECSYSYWPFITLLYN